MKRFFKLIAVYCLLIAVLSACGSASAPAEESESPQAAQAALPTPSASLSETPAPPTLTSTPPPSATRIIPTFTETFLPTLELPILEGAETALEIWDGQPTYLADSQPGFFFRIKFKPAVWGLTQDSYGQPALGHREIEYCIIAPVGPRGMAPGVQVQHETRQIGTLFFEVNVALSQGVRQFVAYQATDRIIFTGFQVNFVDEIDACLADAEEALATLTSIHESQATPIP